MMKFKVFVMAVAMGMLTTGAFADEMPWGKDVAGRDPMRVWKAIEANPEVQQVRNIFAKHATWERNNVMTGGQYVKDKAVIHVTAGRSWFSLHTAEAGAVASPLSSAKLLFVWRYADVEAAWGSHKSTDPVAQGSVVVNEGEGQLRFPIYLGPGGEFHEVRLVSYKGKTLLYVMEPGTQKYIEEWILQ